MKINKSGDILLFSISAITGGAVSYRIITDSRSVKTTERGGECGYDGAKNINGRRRQSQMFPDLSSPLLFTVPVFGIGQVRKYDSVTF